MCVLGVLEDIGKVMGGVVGSVVEFHVRPHILDRIEFRGIGWKMFRGKSAMMADPSLHFSASMTGEPIPDQDDMPA